MLNSVVFCCIFNDIFWESFRVLCKPWLEAGPLVALVTPCIFESLEQFDVLNINLFTRGLGVVVIPDGYIQRPPYGNKKLRKRKRKIFTV